MEIYGDMCVNVVNMDAWISISVSFTRIDEDLNSLQSTNLPIMCKEYDCICARGFAASFSLNQFSEASIFIKGYVNNNKSCGFELE